MSNERRAEAREIVGSYFTAAGGEPVIGDDPEIGFVTAVRARCGGFPRAASLCAVVAKRLEDRGFDLLRFSSVSSLAEEGVEVTFLVVTE